MSSNDTELLEWELRLALIMVYTRWLASLPAHRVTTVTLPSNINYELGQASSFRDH